MNPLDTNLGQCGLKPYKGYVGSMHANMEGRFFYGYIDGNESLYYEGETKEMLQAAFKNLVDEVLKSVND